MRQAGRTHSEVKALDSFPKHYFPVIEVMKSEEEECALVLEMMPEKGKLDRIAAKVRGMGGEGPDVGRMLAAVIQSLLEGTEQAAG